MGLVDFLQKHWAVVSASFLDFAVFFVLASIAGFSVARLYFRERLELWRDQAQILEGRLKVKDEQLDDYRKRLLGVDSPKGTYYSSLSNTELRGKVAHVVGRIRSLVEEGDLTRENFGRLPPGSTEEERNSLWDQQARDAINHLTSQMAAYERRFKAETLALRDELTSRLPPSARKDTTGNAYEHPTNTFGIKAVADDLERMALNLPLDRT